MRIELTCEQSLTVFSAVMDLLNQHELALSAMQSLVGGQLFLNLSEVELEEKQLLLSEMRRINGVLDARIVSAMPSEIEHKEVQILLDNVPYPVVLIDKSGNIRQFNQMFEQSCGDVQFPLNSCDISRFIRGFSVTRWFGTGSGKREVNEMLLNGRTYLVDVIPLSETAMYSHLPGAILLFKSAHWLEPSFDLAQIELGMSEGRLVASSDVMTSVLNSMKRLSEHPIPTLLFGEVGVGKRFIAQLLNEMTEHSDEGFYLHDCQQQKRSLKEHLADIAAERPTTLLLQDVEYISHSELEDALKALSQPCHGIRHIVLSSRFSPEQLSSMWGGADYYGLIKNSIHIPSLRQRKDDIVPLAQAWLDRQFAMQQEHTPPLSRDVKKYLGTLSWSGNIPQLHQVLQDTLDATPPRRWQVSDIKYQSEGGLSNISVESLLQQEYHAAMHQFEYLLLNYHFPQYPSSRLLAKKLGISHTAIANKLREHRIRNRNNSDK